MRNPLAHRYPRTRVGWIAAVLLVAFVTVVVWLVR